MKRAIKVKLEKRAVTNYITSYTCPSCKVRVDGAEISRKVTRFRCYHCNRELIIEDRET